MANRNDDSANTGQEQLRKALAIGPVALKQQVRIVLMLAHLNRPRSTISMVDELPLDVRYARIIALRLLPDTSLSDDQYRALIRYAYTIADHDLRWLSLARLAAIRPAIASGLIRDIWQNSGAIKDPTIRADALLTLAPLIAGSGLISKNPDPFAQLMAEALSLNQIEARVRILTAIDGYLPRDQLINALHNLLTDLPKTRNDAIVTKSLIALMPYLPPELFDDAATAAESIANPLEQASALMALALNAPPQRAFLATMRALETIDIINNEEARAEALIACAPTLDRAIQIMDDTDYQGLVHRVLTITIMIGRRPLRARVLVALAAHLESDLLGEALAAVHSLTADHDRALLLAQLAPNLPDDMLVASLAIAHTMQEQDSRVHALGTLARYASDKVRRQTILDALAAASNLPNHLERVQALVGLQDVLPAGMRETALNNALQASAAIQNESARARSLTLLAEHLSEALVEEAINIAQGISIPEHRLNALLALYSFSTATVRPQLAQEMVTCARAILAVHKRARAVINMAPTIDASVRQQVMELARGFEEPIDQITIYVALLPSIPTAERIVLIAEAWHALVRIDEGYDRIEALANLMPYLPRSAMNDVVNITLASIRTIADEYDRASAIALLVPHFAELGKAGNDLPDAFGAIRRGMTSAMHIRQGLARAEVLARGVQLAHKHLDKEQAYLIWQELAPQIANLTLAEALLCIGALVPIMGMIGGAENLRAIAHLLGLR